MKLHLTLVPSLLALLCTPATANETPPGAAQPEVDLTRCEDLVASAEETAEQQRALGRQTADIVNSGGDVEERSCVGDLQDFDFNFFDSIPSFSTAVLEQAREEAWEQMSSMACDAANNAEDVANTLLTCSASVGVSLSASAGFDEVDPEECAGLGFDEELDLGDHEAGGGDSTIGGDSGGDVGHDTSDDSNENSEWELFQ